MAKEFLGEKVIEGVHHIRCPFSRPGYFTSACAILDETVTLIDSGVPTSPEEAVFPYLRSLGNKPINIARIILTHAHFDHCGGASILKRKFGAKVAVHILDKPLLEDPVLLNRQLNSRFPELYPLDSNQEFEGVEADLILEDGAKINLDGHVLRVIPTPGHSDGSIALLDEETGLCVTGDSVQGRGEKRPLLFSSSIDYINSVKRLMTEPIKMLVLGHPFPPFNKGILRDEEVKTFLVESLRCIEERQEKVLKVIEESRKTPSLKDICARIPEAQPVTIGCIMESLQH